MNHTPSCEPHTIGWYQEELARVNRLALHRGRELRLLGDKLHARRCEVRELWHRLDWYRRVTARDFYSLEPTLDGEGSAIAQAPLAVAPSLGDSA